MKKFLFYLIVLFVFSACTDVDKNDKGILVVHLTDSPAEYEEVLVDIKELNINYSGSSSWENLPLLVNEPIDLLTLTNGRDTLLTEEALTSSKISQIRMVLGDNNRVKKGGEYYDLIVPSAQKSGLKLNINKDVPAGVTYEMWIDFDASRSIVQRGNGKYALKPVIRVFSEATSGSIIGRIKPFSEKVLVQAVSFDNDTVSTFSSETDGGFVLRGLDAGAYTFLVKPTVDYKEIEKKNVPVIVGKVTDLGTVLLTD